MPDDALLEAGMHLVAELPDVLPDEAEGEVAAIYDDVQRVLRVPFVNSLFRVLANEPEWLSCAWRGTAAVAATRRFEAAADRLRAEALLPGAGREPLDLGPPDDERAVIAYTRSIQYVLPKLLVIASGFARALEGEAGGAEADEPAADLPLGVAAAATKAPMVDPAEAAEPAGRVLREIPERHGHPVPATWYRGLANWPGALERVWERVARHLDHPEYGERRARLVALGDEHAAALGLAGRMRSCRRETETDLRAVVAVFRRRLVPDLLIDTTLTRAAVEGREAAASSPLSAS